MTEIKKKYNEFAKKHKLPDFDEMDNAFEISCIEKEDFLLRAVRRKMNEKLDAYIEMLNGILNPETDIVCMHECSVFNEDEKTILFGVYKRLMFLNRLSIETALDEDDKKTSAYINEAFKELNKLKKEIAPFIAKIKESWLKDTDIKEEFKYLG